MKASDSPGELTGIRGRDAEALELAGIKTVAELLDWFPKRYEDRRRFDAFPAQAGGGAVCLRGLVVDTQRKGFGGKGFYEAVVEDHAGGGFSRLTCRWFNMPFMQKVLPRRGMRLFFTGSPRRAPGDW